ncbi:MAG: hypothetical protein Q9M24_02165 [Mariprofundaceae bacterium]|nr:hypothetical protein [Mariprofundaceae bacterium]
MNTRRILFLLFTLTALVLARTVLSLWPGDKSTHHVIQIANAAVATPRMKPQAKKTAHTASNPSLIAEAHASIMPESDHISDTERESLLNLRKIKNRLDKRGRELDKREQATVGMEKKAAQRIADLEELETRIQDMLAQEKSISNKKIKRLTAVYEGMKADKAALVIARMDLLIVVKMFSRMDEKKVGKILSFLSPELAVKISQALTQKIASLNP